MITKLNNQEKNINYKKIKFKRDKKLDFDFRDYRSLKELFKEINYRNMSVDEAEKKQDEYEVQLFALERYRQKILIL